MSSHRIGQYRSLVAGCFAGFLTFLAPSAGNAQSASTHEIVLTVLSVKPIDKADELSHGDFFVRATIAGETLASSVLTKSSEFKPGWKLSKRVAAGEHAIRLELVDKDVSVDDPIDINRVANKRDLDFTVNTRTCRITGFAQSYRCGTRIIRAGSERKRAQITFTVTVVRK